MACFLVPAGEAVVTTIIQKVIENKEKRGNIQGVKVTGQKWSWLNKLLWGGSALLLVEHVLQGEVVPWPPFLTAMENPASIASTLNEMATVGVAMAVIISVVWVVMVLLAEHKMKAIHRTKENLDCKGS